jgi:hypothetical protein
LNFEAEQLFGRRFIALGLSLLFGKKS